MKASGGVDLLIQVFLTSALVGDEWLALRPCSLTPGEGGLGTHWIGNWIHPRDGQNDMQK
jgi:hypothetical protein